jgi:hypothetical protein
LYKKSSDGTLLRCLDDVEAKTWWRNLWKEIWSVDMVH